MLPWLLLSAVAQAGQVAHEGPVVPPRDDTAEGAHATPHSLPHPLPVHGTATDQGPRAGPHAAPLHPPRHGVHHTVAVSAISAAVLQGGDSHPLGGAVLTYERPIVGALEVEASLGAVGHTGRLEVPAVLALMSPLRFNPKAELHLGGGPALTVVHELDHGTEVHPGVVLTGDLYVWATDHVGAVFKLDGVAQVVHAALIPEVETGVGAALRF